MTNKERIQDLMNNGSLEVLLKLFTKIIGKDALDGKNGGYFTIQYLDENNTVISKKLNSILAEKKEKYRCLSTEKASRLKRNLTTGHLTSYESRNPESTVIIEKGRIENWGHWGGAVLINKNFIFSFSGFPELVDEAFVCFLGFKSGLMSKCQLGIIKKRRIDNPYLDIIYQELTKK
ncbi:hypothetical protein K9M48_00890 [Candidatus Gracilibacteria bacterium]|nr:hypothetical protein [Candidatus Gracilibacteria bacterium]